MFSNRYKQNYLKNFDSKTIIIKSYNSMFDELFHYYFTYSLGSAVGLVADSDTITIVLESST